MPVPQRILIFGPSGAGKSTLARQIGARLGLRVVHLDALFWAPGWVMNDDAVFREKIAQAANREAWVMDGNYSAHLDLRLSRAEAVIWLDLPRSVYFLRALWRSIRHYGRERDDLGPQCPEKLNIAFLKGWVWTYPARRRHHAELMASLPEGIRGITLRSPRQVTRFVKGLPASLEE